MLIYVDKFRCPITIDRKLFSELPNRTVYVITEQHDQHRWITAAMIHQDVTALRTACLVDRLMEHFT